MSFNNQTTYMELPKVQDPDQDPYNRTVTNLPPYMRFSGSTLIITPPFPANQRFVIPVIYTDINELYSMRQSYGIMVQTKRGVPKRRTTVGERHAYIVPEQATISFTRLNMLG